MNRKRELWEWIEAVALALMIAIPLRMFVVQSYRRPSTGERFLVYKLGAIHVGDEVIVDRTKPQRVRVKALYKLPVTSFGIRAAGSGDVAIKTMHDNIFTMDEVIGRTVFVYWPPKRFGASMVSR